MFIHCFSHSISFSFTQFLVITKFLLEDTKGRYHAKDLVVDGKIISEWILGTQDGKVWTGRNLDESNLENEGARVTGDTFMVMMESPYENSFPVRWCTTPLLPSRSCLSGQGVFWSLDEKRGTHSLDCFWGFVNDNPYRENTQNVTEWFARQNRQNCRVRN